MRKSKKLMAFVLSMAMVLSNVSLSTTTSYAEGPTTSEITSESTTVDDNTTETNDGFETQVLTQDELNELLSEQDISTEENDTEDNTSEDISSTETVVDLDDISTEAITDASTEETTEETTTEEDTTEEVTTEENSIDATTLTYRLIVATENTDILTNGVVISNLDDLYIVGFATEDEREKAIEYYTPIADFVEKDDDIFESNDIATSTDNTEVSSEEPVIENTDDAFTAYEELSENEKDIKDVQEISKKNTIIAVIDTGASEDQIKSDNIINAVSVINNSEIDDNGHGSEMINTIINENPDAKILSIRALNFEGKASASDIYSAIKYAIDNKVDIINLSLSAYNTEENSIVKDIIQEAIDNKIVVIGSAGNKYKDVKYFIPGCIDDVLVIGCCNENGYESKLSNFGETVDYYVVATSTSKATAMFTGRYSIKNEIPVDDNLIYTKTLEETINTDIKLEDHLWPEGHTIQAICDIEDSSFYTNFQNGQTVTVYANSSISYGYSWGTNIFSVGKYASSATDANAYCVQPSASTPAGTYSIREITNNETLRKIAYYSPGGYGYNNNQNSVKQHYINGTGTSNVNTHYVAAHIMLARAYGASDWAYCASSTYDNLYNALKGLPTPTTNFHIYEIQTGAGQQNLLCFDITSNHAVRVAKVVKANGGILSESDMRTLFSIPSGQSEWTVVAGATYRVATSNHKDANGFLDTDILGECIIEDGATCDNVSSPVNVPDGKTIYIQEYVAPNGLKLNKTVYTVGPFTVNDPSGIYTYGKAYNPHHAALDLGNTIDTDLYDEKTVPKYLQIGKRYIVSTDTASNGSALDTNVFMVVPNNRDNYKVRNATYKLCTDVNGKNIIAQFTVRYDKNGNALTDDEDSIAYCKPIDVSNYMKISGGAYQDTKFYLFEIDSSKGAKVTGTFDNNGKVLSTRQTITVPGGNTKYIKKDSPYNYTAKEVPVTANLTLQIRKKDLSKKPIKGSEFVLRYYKVDYNDKSASLKNTNGYFDYENINFSKLGKPTRQWVYKTDANGNINFYTSDTQGTQISKSTGTIPSNQVAYYNVDSSNHATSNTYYQVDGKNVFPLGLYILTEISTPDPYTLEGGTLKFKSRLSSDGMTSETTPNNSYYVKKTDTSGIVFRITQTRKATSDGGTTAGAHVVDHLNRELIGPTIQASNNNAYNYIDVSNPEPSVYYAVVRKVDLMNPELEYMGVPLALKITCKPIKEGVEQAQDTKYVYPWLDDNNTTIHGCVSGYYTEVDTTQLYSFTNAKGTNMKNFQSELISRVKGGQYSGLTIIRLGEFKTPPTVVVQEAYYSPDADVSYPFAKQCRDRYAGTLDYFKDTYGEGKCFTCKNGNTYKNSNGTSLLTQNEFYSSYRTSANNITISSNNLFAIKASEEPASNSARINAVINSGIESDLTNIQNLRVQTYLGIIKTDGEIPLENAEFDIYGVSASDVTSAKTLAQADVDKWNAKSDYISNVAPSGLNGTKLTFKNPDTNAPIEIKSDKNGKIILDVSDYYSPTQANNKYQYFYAVETATGNDAKYVILTKANLLNTIALTDTQVKDILAKSDEESTQYDPTFDVEEAIKDIIHNNMTEWINQPRVKVKCIKTIDTSDCAYDYDAIKNNPNYKVDGIKFLIFNSQADARSALDAIQANSNVIPNTNTLHGYVGTINLNSTTMEGDNILDVTSEFIHNYIENKSDTLQLYCIEYMPSSVHGYYINEDIVETIVTVENDENNPAEFIITNKPVDDPFQLQLQKHDAYLNQDGVQYLPKGVTFEGTEVQLKYYALDINQNYTQAQLNSRTPDQIINLTSDANGYINYEDDFPLGYITIAEVGAPTGYSDDPSKINYTFTIGTDNYDITDNRAFILDWQNDDYKIYLSKGHRDVTDQMTTATLNLFDPPIRKDITIKKVTEDNENIEGVSFRIDLLDDNNRVVESKTITTNSQGIATTLNGGELTWFTTTNDSRNTYPYNATEVAEYHLGSMPVGHYKVTELPSETNKTYQLPSPLYFEITGDDNEPDVIPVADYNGTIVNVKYPTIDTTASVTSTGTKQLPYGSSQVIKDHIVVDRLRYGGNKYTIVGTLKVVDENGDVSDYSESGEYTKTFTITTPVTRPATAKSEFSYRHEEDLQFPVTVNKNLEGKKLVVFLKLYYGTSTNPVKQYPEYDGIDYTATGRRLMFPLVHEDETNTKETVYVPKIRTHAVVARDNGTEGKALLGKPSELVYDILEYENLLPNTTYTVKGVLNYAFLHSDDTSWKTINNDNTVTFTTPNAVGDAKTVSGTTDINGNTVKVPFTVNGENLAGSNIVLYERLYNGNSTTLELAKHEDMNDPEQQLSTLSIKTNAIDDNTNIQVAKNGETIFVDRVDIIGLEVGKTYRLTGTLYDANSSINAPSPIKNAQNTVITHTETFTADSETYELEKGNAFEMHYPIDISNLRGTTVVVFETLEKQNDDGTWDTEPAAVHKELRDLAQMVHIPEISTTAQDSQTGLTNPTLVEYNETATITDYINYNNLVPNQVYYIEGNIHEKDNPTNIIAEIKLTDNETYTPEGELTSVGVSGRIPVNFTFNSTNISGKTLVAYEKLYVKVGTQNIEVASHTSEIDNNQTIKVANVTTHVLSDQGTHYTEDDGIHEFTDTVDYFNVVSGKNYIVRGQLYYNNSNPAEFRGQPVLDANGQPYKSDSGVFSANAIDGHTTVKYTVDTRDLTARHIVVYEDLYLVKDDNTEVLVASHHDIADKDQTFFISSIKTTATDDSTKIHVAKNGQTTLNDQVTVKGLVIGDKYRIKGCLMDANSDPDDPQKIVNAQGNAITSTYPNENGFTAEHIIYDETTEYINIPYPIDVTNMDGTTIVIFEVLEHWDAIESKWEVVAEHQDIADIEQFVHIPSMSTSAKDSATGLTNPTLVEYNNTAKVTDTLTYGNLLPNQEYYIEGNIHEKGNPNNIIAKVEIADNKTFTPEGDENSLGVSGTIPVEFTFNSTNLKGKTLVIYEKLKVKVGNTEVEVADHTSELDMNQTIKVAQVETKVLSDQDTKYADSDGIHTFTDTVHYSNVIEGEKYRIRGQLYYNNDNPDDIKGTPVLDANGNEYKSVSDIFTADENGDVEMPYTINTEPLAGRHIVVYEDLYLVKDENDETKDVHIAQHHNVNDYDQTFFIVNLKTKATDDNTNINVTMNGITTITDTVDYKGVDKNKKYIICGTLMERIVDETTGDVSYEPFKREDGTVYTADSGVFNSGNAINGTKLVKFVVNPTVLETDKTIVIFEKLYYIDEDHDNTRIEIAKHENINDIIQMAHIPHIHTLAMDKGTKLTDPTMTTYGTEIEVVDTVSYHNLLPNIEYTIKGELFELVPVVKEDEENPDNADENNADENADEENPDVDNEDNNDEEEVEEEVEMQIVSTGIVGESTFTPKTTDEGVTPNVVVTDGEEPTIVTIDGTYPITFTFDSTKYADRTFVVYEKLYLTNTETNELVEIADHTDINDTKQTIHIPKITTEATDSVTGLHLGELREHITMDDVVSYTNVVPNNFYQVKGILMNKDTNEPYLDKNGEEVISYSEVFVPKTDSGDINVHYDFNIDLSELPTDKDKETLNLRLVVFEELYLVNDPSIEVEDEDDTNNDDTDNNDDANNDGDDANNDGNNDQNNDQNNNDANNENVDNNDANGLNGGQPINLDDEDDQNNDDLNNDDNNDDLNNDDLNNDNNDNNDDNNDIDETPVTQAQIDSANEIINAEFTEDVDANLEIQKKINAYADEYGLPEDLYNKDAEFTEEVFNAVKNYLANFVEDAEVVDVDMTKPAKPIALVAIHKDIDDEGQTVNFTTIRTTLTGIPEKEVHETKADEEIELIDYVYYHNLLVGKTYTVSGILMKKPKTENEEPTKLLDKDGNEITAKSEPFTINSEEEVNGVVPITFKFDGSLLKGETTVAYEELYQDDIYVTSHKDITDEDQTVHMPKIGTMAFNSDTELQTAPVDKKVNITDTVMFENLVYGNTYVLTGSLMDKETGEVLKDNNGKEIVATQTFTVSEEDKNVTIEEIFANDGLPYEENTDVEDTDKEETTDEDDTDETEDTDDENAEDIDGNEVDEETVKVIRTKTHASGKVNVEFKNINTLNLVGKDTVVFEVLVNKDTNDEVADHKDKDDKDQNIKFPTVHTTALDKVDGDKLLDCRENTHTIVDTVHYTNLIPGKEYTLKAKVAIKPKNKSDKINFVTLKDKETYVTHTFIPEKTEGDEKVEITFDTSEYVTNNHLVVFEDLYYNDVLLYSHADIEDEDQTIFLGMQLEVQIGKADKDNIKYYLKDAEITIFNKDGTVAKDINGKECVGLTDTDGQIKFNVVYDPDNTYYAQETKAPKGYNINPDKFELKPTGEKNKLGADVIKITILDSIIIIPPKTPKTPKTSDIISIALVLALIGIGACGIIVFRKRKKNR